MFIFRNLRRKIPKVFWFFHWNPYLKTDSANIPCLFSLNDFHKKKYVEISMQSFYVMFPAIMYVLHLEKHKMQNIRNHNINTENRPTVSF